MPWEPSVNSSAQSFADTLSAELELEESIYTQASPRHENPLMAEEGVIGSTESLVNARALTVR
eukprot:4586808-Pyramimonas_sp.AAC.1